MKRFFDLFISSFLLVILIPFLLPFCIILRFTGEGEIFYLQDRIGKGLVPFKMLKFATMLKDSPHIGSGMLTMKGDPRVFPFGQFLRKTKINELPQLWNVIRGDISLVGPRPQVKSHFDYFSAETIALYSTINPGVTGIDSIVFRDEESLLMKAEKENIDYYKEVITPIKGELVKWYVINQSMMTDLKILTATVLCILLPKSKFYFSWFKDLPQINV